MATLGFACTSSYAYLAAAEGDTVLDITPQRLGFRDGLPEAEQLIEFGKDVSRALRDVKADEVVLLRAASNYEDTHTKWTARLAMETLVRLVSAKAGITCRYLSHQAVKGTLGLTGRGALTALGKDCVARSGRYWGEGRASAALAAVAAENGA